MKKEIVYYQIKPSVVPADKLSQIEIACFEKYYGFKDGVKYIVEFTPTSVPKKPFSDKYLLLEPAKTVEKVEVIAKDGKLKLSYLFNGEQRWRVKVYATEPTFDNELYEPYKECWGAHLKATQNGCIMEMYSVYEDLYGLKAYKGDLHLHTYLSDAVEVPETTAANYRKQGFDFISMTDHHIYKSAGIANEAYRDLKTNFTIYNGEEIHNDYVGQIHMVNFDSDWSVNDRILNDREAVLAEFEEIKQSPELSECFDKTDIAWRTWVYREIKKSGGLAIFPHPYWDVCLVEHASDESVNYVFKNKLMDAFEVLGGCSYSDNNMQMVLYNEMRANGYDYPIVGSTDSHSSREYGISGFGIAYTVAFAKDTASIREAIENGLTVAVQNENEKMPNITGSLRLSKYARFLIDNYFPIHDELCHVSGIMMKKYYFGDRKNAKMICEANEQYIKTLENDFFGEGL